jgi:hypothetical protein
VQLCLRHLQRSRCVRRSFLCIPVPWRLHGFRRERLRDPTEQILDSINDLDICLRSQGDSNE